MQGTWHNCHVDIRGVNRNYAGLIAQGAGGVGLNTTRQATKFAAYDCIFTVQGETATYSYIATGNNMDTSGVVYDPSRLANFVTNVPYQTADSPDTRRYTNATGTLYYRPNWTVGRKPVIGEIDAAPARSLLGGYTLFHDKYWNARRSGISAIGPVEAA